MIKVELCWQDGEPQYICGVYLVPGVESWQPGGGGHPLGCETFLPSNCIFLWDLIFAVLIMVPGEQLSPG